MYKMYIIKNVLKDIMLIREICINAVTVNLSLCFLIDNDSEYYVTILVLSPTVWIPARISTVFTCLFYN